jgi:hypothetical protein
MRLLRETENSSGKSCAGEGQGTTQKPDWLWIGSLILVAISALVAYIYWAAG